MSFKTGVERNNPLFCSQATQKEHSELTYKVFYNLTRDVYKNLPKKKETVSYDREKTLTQSLKPYNTLLTLDITFFIHESNIKALIMFLCYQSRSLVAITTRFHIMIILFPYLF